MCGKTSCAKPDCTWSESHRKDCEIRHVLRLSPSQRSEHYCPDDNGHEIYVRERTEFEDKFEMVTK